jgi:hypothetical protein
MPLIYIVLVLIVVGMALWLINAYIPMAGLGGHPKPANEGRLKTGQ